MNSTRLDLLFLSDVCREIGVDLRRVDHAIRMHHVCDPPIVRGRRLFSPGDVRRLRVFFEERRRGGGYARTGEEKQR